LDVMIPTFICMPCPTSMDPASGPGEPIVRSRIGRTAAPGECVGHKENGESLSHQD
jgi:hypothetical protein